MKLSLVLLIILFASLTLLQAQVINQDDFEGSGNINWTPLFYSNTNMQWEENLLVVPNPFGSGNVGKVQDLDTSYTGAALVGGDIFTYQHLAIEADVYCYVGGSSSRYTGVALMADTSVGTSGEINTRYVKLVADFDDNMGAGPRLRLYNSDLDINTFQYTFDVKFYASDIPGGIPVSDGWHHIRLEARTINADSVEYTCFFDNNLVGGGPVYDYTYDTGTRIHNPFFPGTFGLFAFQQGADLPGYFDNIEVEQLSLTAIGDNDNNIVDGFALAQNFPNPFNPSTQISFTIATTENVQLSVFNSLGQKMRTLVSDIIPAGTHQVTWNGSDDSGNELPAGIYYYQMKAGEFQQTRKMLFVK